MRYVVKPDSNLPPSLSHPNTLTELLNISRKVPGSIIRDAIYRDPYDDEYEKRSRVEDGLALYYLNKCAYCERLCKADIEHYRPKNAVEGVTHDGYYWLCYEWTNLIPACVKCNRDGGKHTKFEILGNRERHPNFLPNGELDFDKSKAHNKPLIDEIPVLLHPEIDRPEQFFEFEIHPTGDGIIIKGIDTQGRGNKTIEICKLNRQELRLERKREVIDPFRDAIHSCLGLLRSGDYNFDEFAEKTEDQIRYLNHRSLNQEYSHTLFRKYVVASSANFAKIIIPHIETTIQSLVLQAFITVLNR